MSCLKNPEKKLKSLLRKYSFIHDFIIFGSFVKDKIKPADIDIAAVVSEKKPLIIGQIKSEIDKSIKNAHLQIISYGDFLQSKLPYHILFEGYSVRQGRFIHEKLHISRKALYTFELSDLPQTKKVMFNKGLKSLVERTNSEKTGKGGVLVPINSAGEFEDFLKLWNRKIKKKEFIEI